MFETFGSVLTGLNFSLEVFGPFLKTDVKTDVTIELLKLSCKKYANMYAFFLIIFVGISFSWLALLASSLLLFLRTCF